MKHEKLTIFNCISYASPAFALSIMAMTFFVYGPKYYSDQVGLSLKIIGAVVFFSRIWDAITDPLCGYLSDRTKSRYGRRMPWMMVSLLPLALLFILVFNPSLFTLPVNDAVLFTLVTVAFFLLWTTFSIPYESLGAEISFDYNERNKLFSFREGFVVLGTVGAASFPLMFAEKDSILSTLPKLSIGYSIILVLSFFIFFLNTKEKTWNENKIPKGSPLQNIKEVWGNQAFRILLISYAVGAFSGALPATLILYYVEYVLGASESQANLFLLEYFVVALVFLPAWVFLAKKIGKKEAWIASMLVNTVAFIGVFFLGKGDTTAYGILVALSAIGYGATLALPSSMQADVIDLDEQTHGTRKEGQFVGLWAIAKKSASAIGAGAALWILGETGYQVSGVQNEQTVYALRILYAAVPCIGNIIAISIAWKYPITKEVHLEIREKIEAT